MNTPAPQPSRRKLLISSGSVIGVIGLLIGYLQLAGDRGWVPFASASPSSSPAATASGSPNPQPSPSASPGPLRHDHLVMKDDFAVNLDSTASDWDVDNISAIAWHDGQNFEWFAKKDAIAIEDWEHSVAVLPASAPLTPDACKAAPKGTPFDWKVGLRLCIWTRGGHLVLAELLSITKATASDPAQTTLDVQVWPK